MQTAHYEYVIDFDGFRNVMNELIPKELTIINITLSRVNTYLFHSPLNSNWSLLPLQVRRTNQFCLDKLHGIEYTKGDIEFERITDILQKYTEGSWKIYCNGTEKCAVLSKILGKAITNLQDYVLPTLNMKSFTLPNADNFLYCNNHKVSVNKTTYSCSLNKALRFTYALNVYNKNILS